MMTWLQFSARYPEEGADWLAYWRDRELTRAHAEFQHERYGVLRATEVDGERRQWVHHTDAVEWSDVGVA